MYENIYQSGYEPTKYDKQVKIYLASPFFNEEQIDRVERVKRILIRKGFNVYSPKDELVCSPEPTKTEAEFVFLENCYHIDDCDFVLAITDGKDVGTIWEAGYAFAKGKKIIYYCETLGDKPFNLMLAQSGIQVIRGESHLMSMNIFQNLMWNGKIE